MSDILTSNMSGAAARTAINAAFENVNTALSEINDWLLTSRSALISKNMPIASGVGIGDLVYYDPAVAKLKKARANLQVDAQGRSTEDLSARVEGMIVDVDASGNTGALLRGGSYVNENCIISCLGSATATAGTYYLSSTTAGKALATVPTNAMRYPVLTYYGDGEFTLPIMYQAHDTHMHASLTLTQGHWTATSEKAGYNYKYAFNATELGKIGVLSSANTAIFKSGALCTDTTKICIDSTGTLYCVTAVAAETVVLFNSYPFAYGAAVVRSIGTSTPTRLALESNAGVYDIALKDFYKSEKGASTYNAHAVSDIISHTIEYTPIVSCIANGSGIIATQGADGVYTVELSRNLGKTQEAYSINFNGALQSTENMLTYIVFPAGRDSSIIITMPVVDYPNNKYEARIWCMTKGGSGVLSTSGMFVPNATSAATVDLSTLTPGVGATAAISAASTIVSYVESSEVIEITGGKDGLLVAKVKPTTIPTADIQLLRIGFKITAVASAITAPSSGGTSTGAPNVVHKGVAAEPIEINTCLRMTSTGLRPCDASYVAQADTCVGVAATAGSTGSIITYVTQGTLTLESAGSFTAGDRLYVGAAGAITKTVPASAKFTQCIGVASANNEILINLGAAVVL